MQRSSKVRATDSQLAAVEKLARQDPAAYEYHSNDIIATLEGLSVPFKKNKKELDENEFKASLQEELGVRPPWALEAFNDPYEDTTQSIRRLQLSPFLKHADEIRGFVYDVDSGRMDEVI